MAPYYMSLIGAVSGNTSLRFPITINVFALALKALAIFILKLKSPAEVKLEEPSRDD